MLNKNDMLLLGIGEAGNRIVSEILKKDRRYVGLFINTSYKDIMQLDNAKNVFVIPSADGTGRNRALAQYYVKDYSNSIIDQIDKFPLQRVLTVCFSFGGGSGSGITPLLIKLLSVLRPTKLINVVGVLPSADESNKVKQNTIECWNELIALPNINQLFLLDNGKRENKYQINREFADLFDMMMDISKPMENSNLGVIDSSDAEVIITAKGSSAIFALDNDCEDTKIALAKAFKKSIFADFSKDDCSYLGISLLPDSVLDRSVITKQFKPRKDKFIEGYNVKGNLVLISGCDVGLQKGAIEYLDLTIADSVSDSNVTTVEDLVIGKKKKTSSFVETNAHLNNVKAKSKEKDLDKMLDDDDLWNEIMNM